MTPKTAKLAILFADVSGSASLYERLGDKHAQQLIATVLQTITKIIRQHEGKIIKTIGDEVMCVFSRVEKAVEAAAAVHKKFHDPSATHEHMPLQMRIGLHYGPVLFEQGDVYGDAVNMAARMVNQAKALQTVISEDTFHLLPESLQQVCRPLDRIVVKGKKELTTIYEIVWQGDDVTCLAKTMRPIDKTNPVNKIQLSYHNKGLTLDQTRHTLLLGRSKDCDMYVDEELASRYHVRLEMRRSQFFIIDQSTNGTHLRSAGQTAFLHREEKPLSGNGEISLGKAFSDNPTELVLFSEERKL